MIFGFLGKFRIDIGGRTFFVKISRDENFDLKIFVSGFSPGFGKGLVKSLPNGLKSRISRLNFILGLILCWTNVLLCVNHRVESDSASRRLHVLAPSFDTHNKHTRASLPCGSNLESTKRLIRCSNHMPVPNRWPQTPGQVYFVQLEDIFFQAKFSSRKNKKISKKFQLQKK